MRSIRQTETGRHALDEFRPGDVVNIWGLQTAFILGRNEDDFPDSLDLLWVDSIGVIVILSYTIGQVRAMVAQSGIVRR